MKFKVPEGLTLKPYEDPKKTGYYGWLENADGDTVGFLKSAEDAKFLSVADAAGLSADDTPDPASDQPPVGRDRLQAATESRPAKRRRSQTNRKGSKMPKKGETPTLHQLNSLTRRNEAKLRRKRDPSTDPFKSVGEGVTYTKRVLDECNRQRSDATQHANKVIRQAETAAAALIEAATSDAQAIREGAMAEAKAAGAR